MECAVARAVAAAVATTGVEKVVSRGGSAWGIRNRQCHTRPVIAVPASPVVGATAGGW